MRENLLLNYNQQSTEMKIQIMNLKSLMLLLLQMHPGYLVPLKHPDHHMGLDGHARVVVVIVGVLVEMKLRSVDL